MVLPGGNLPPGGIIHNPSTSKAEYLARYPHSSIEANIMRTFNPGYASYTGDGSGRDSYIILNNGGLTKESKNGMMNIRKPGRSPHRNRTLGTKPAPAFCYKSDGSGRDSYVIKNSGGLITDFRTNLPMAIFTSQLRQSD